MIDGRAVFRRVVAVVVGVTAVLAVGASAPAAAVCPAVPAANCRVAEGAKLSIHNAADDAKDQLLWKWAKGEGLARPNLGDPLTGTAYALCLYAGSAQALVGEASLPAGAGWKDVTSGGYGFSAPNADGLRFALLKPGESGRASAAVKGKGAGLPDLPTPFELPLTVQLTADPEPLCLTTRFATGDAAVNTATRFKAQARGSLPVMERVIPVDDACNKSGDDGSVAEQLGAQMRRSGSEWASTCLGYFGAAGNECEVAFPGDTPFPDVPAGVASLTCENVAACDHSLGRVEWHAEDKFARKCSLDQWQLVWEWIQERAGAAAPPDCDVYAFAPRFWGVFTCYEQHYVHPLMLDMLAKLRAHESSHPTVTPACEGAVVTRLWWRLASDWIRFGKDVCRDVYRDTQVDGACGTGTATPQIDQATIDEWCADFTAFLRPVYEGVRAASGKPY